MSVPADIDVVVDASDRAALLREGIVVLEQGSTRGSRRVGVSGAGTERVLEAGERWEGPWHSRCSTTDTAELQAYDRRMGERTSYPPGTFSWAELATSDSDGAKSFYSTLFGWDYDDMPIPEGGVYSMAKRDGKQVAAVFSSDEPPHWNCYVTVASVEESAARGAELGGTVVAEPFDVMDVGRMAVFADPTGAVLCLWEPRSSIGAALVNTPGALTWNDLLTPDAAAAAGFYGELFDWTTQEMPDSGGYRVIRNGERSNGGIMPLDPAGMGAETPPNWMPYFGHEDVERLVGEVGGVGGQVFNGPMQMPQGTIAVLGDPQGAAFAVWTGEYDD